MLESQAAVPTMPGCSAYYARLYYARLYMALHGFKRLQTAFKIHAININGLHLQLCIVSL